MSGPLPTGPPVIVRLKEHLDYNNNKSRASQSNDSQDLGSGFDRRGCCRCRRRSSVLFSVWIQAKRTSKIKTTHNKWSHFVFSADALGGGTNDGGRRRHRTGRPEAPPSAGRGRAAERKRHAPDVSGPSGAARAAAAPSRAGRQRVHSSPCGSGGGRRAADSSSPKETTSPTAAAAPPGQANPNRSEPARSVRKMLFQQRKGQNCTGMATGTPLALPVLSPRPILFAVGAAAAAFAVPKTGPSRHREHSLCAPRTHTDNSPAKCTISGHQMACLSIEHHGQFVCRTSERARTVR